ncbi:hypothetical protein GCM10010255_30070 [Streptomyces coeruleofuscus]|uniref:Aminoglycoside phosphotransferase domain-containing protein n=1 Tax=Streptomyces coeruleofuscus TaxID=66879 RepID=A0ABP5VDF9_9ACTN
MTPHPLLDIAEVARTEPYLLAGGERWFVKQATTDAAQHALNRAWVFHRAVRPAVIVPQPHRFATGDGRTAAVMPWHDGELLHSPARLRHAGPLTRFQALRTTVHAPGPRHPPPDEHGRRGAGLAGYGGPAVARGTGHAHGPGRTLHGRGGVDRGVAALGTRRPGQRRMTSTASGTNTHRRNAS